MFKYELGVEVKDKITGFTGIAMSRCEYLTGCVQYGVCPQQLTKDGDLPTWHYLDEDRLILLGGEKEEAGVVGGPQQTPSKQS